MAHSRDSLVEPFSWRGTLIRDYSRRMRQRFRVVKMKEVVRTYLWVCVVTALTLATATATLPSSNVPAGTERSCCARMVHAPGDCPPQPQQGPAGSSCCNMHSCLQLFLQTGEVNLEPGSAEVEWETLSTETTNRIERPPVPPPRVGAWLASCRPAAI